MIRVHSAPPVDRILHLSDWQRFTWINPSRAVQVTEWIAAHAETRRYKGTVFTGDMDDHYTSDSWAQARVMMAPLLGMGFAVLAEGNHDRDKVELSSIDASFPRGDRAYLTYFEQSANSYGLLSLGGKTWGVASLEWGPRDSVLSWLGAAVAADPTIPWIVGVHAYLATDGTRQDWTQVQDGGNPHHPNYAYTFPEGHTPNDGQEIWTKLVSVYSNIKIVLCGHNVAPGKLLVSTRADGSVCYQIMHSQHSTIPWGEPDPELAIREMAFDHLNREIAVSTYSPFTDTHASGLRLVMDDSTYGTPQTVSVSATPSAALVTDSVLVPLGGFPDAFWSAVGLRGKDIRVASHAGVYLPREVVGLDIENKRGDLWVSRGTATSLIVSAGSGLPEPHPLSFGKNAAWESAAKFAAHLEGLTDSTANAANIEATTATLAAGKVGDGYLLNGSSDYLGVPSAFGKPNTLTVMCWFKTTGTNVGIFGGSSAKPTAQPGSYCPFISINSAGKVRGEFWNGTVGSIVSAAAYNDGNWHHVALVGSGTSQELFVDGASQGTLNGTINLSWWTTTTIGTAYDEGARLGTKAWHYMAGMVDEVRVYNRALSAAEIAQVYANQNDPAGFWTIAEL